MTDLKVSVTIGTQAGRLSTREFTIDGCVVGFPPERLMETLLEHLGYTTQFIYAAAAYGLFHWLDKNASDEAKAALARTMSLKGYKSEQVASALVEVFDRIYTHPLLRWRAYLRSLLFTTVVSAIWLYELNGFEIAREAVGKAIFSWGGDTFTNFILCSFLTGLLFNFLTDYLSLFVIRPLLIRSGTKPVIGLALGAVSGAAIVLAGNVLRWLDLTPPTGAVID
jgi:hypothetical protein